MAIDLLRKYSHHPGHIYRHDLESIFYVMVIFFSRYEFNSATQSTSGLEERIKKRSHPPLSDWLDPTLSWDRLASAKWDFMMHAVRFDSPFHTNHIMSSSFGGFKGWIRALKHSLTQGFMAFGYALEEEYSRSLHSTMKL
ncbi:hypothetical protein BDZ89DRAFT_1118785, partial [Hymenopellis radicata]